MTKPLPNRAPATALVPGTPEYREAQQRVVDCPEAQQELDKALRLWFVPAITRALLGDRPSEDEEDEQCP